MAYHNTPVLQFHQAFGHPVETHPTVPSVEQRMLRVKLLAEELCEFAEACGVNLTISQVPTRPLAMGRSEPEISVWPTRDGKVDLVEAADGLADLRYLVDGGNLIFGFPGEALLAEVHRSNMSKLGEDGKPVTRADGKTLKGPNYFQPAIADILAHAAGDTL